MTPSTKARNICRYTRRLYTTMVVNNTHQELQLLLDSITAIRMKEGLQL